MLLCVFFCIDTKNRFSHDVAHKVIFIHLNQFYHVLLSLAHLSHQAHKCELIVYPCSGIHPSSVHSFERSSM